MDAARPNRRALLGSAVALAACRGDSHALRSCGDSLPGAVLLGICAFVGEDDPPLETKTGTGLDARYRIDLAALEEGALVVPAERFYLRTGAPFDLVALADWTVRLGGRVVQERTVDLDLLLARVEPVGIRMFECSGNGAGSAFGLMSAGDFDGVPLSWVLSLVEPATDAVRVQITGRDAHPSSDLSTAGASWIFAPDDLADAWLVTHQDGLPIPLDHGAPMRLLVPGWYGCTNIKWVHEIAWVDDEAPATSQMREFASRTHQDGEPALARDYRPADMQVSAVVARVEILELDGEEILRAVGLLWGGDRDPDVLRLWMDDEDLGPVSLCTTRAPYGWALWEALLPAGARGTVTLRLTAEGVPARRLDSRFYDRRVELG